MAGELFDQNIDEMGLFEGRKKESVATYRKGGSQVKSIILRVTFSLKRYGRITSRVYRPRPFSGNET